MRRVSPRRRVRAVPALALAALTPGCAGHPRPTLAPAAPATRIAATVIFAGDAGVPKPTDPVLAALRGAVLEAPGRTTVVFLGDNIYPAGLPDAGAGDRAEAEARLRAQVDAARDAARILFVPGNHDWARHGDDGWEAVRRQERFIAGAGVSGARLLPEGGCPGPAVLEVGPVRIVALDTQWWLHDGPKPLDPTSSCRADAPGEVTALLREDLRPASSALTVVVGHHPLLTGGPHGGYFTWKDHLFPLTAWKSWLWVPLPIIGSAYPMARALGVSKQDLASGAYGAMRDSLAAVFADGSPLLYAAGHEHNLQVLDGSALGVPTLVVSGAGAYAHTSAVARRPESRYARAASGFVRLDVLDDGAARLAVIVVGRERMPREDYSVWLVGTPPM